MYNETAKCGQHQVKTTRKVVCWKVATGQVKNDSHVTAKHGQYRVISGQSNEKRYMWEKNPGRENSESLAAHGSIETSVIVVDKTRKKNGDIDSTRYGLGSKVGKKQNGSDFTFPGSVKRTPLHGYVLKFQWHDIVHYLELYSSTVCMWLN